MSFTLSLQPDKEHGNIESLNFSKPSKIVNKLECLPGQQWSGLIASTLGPPKWKPGQPKFVLFLDVPSSKKIDSMQWQELLLHFCH